MTATNPRRPIVAPGDLWDVLRARSAAALASGALQPIPTAAHLVRDGGVDFIVRVIDNLERKDRAAAAKDNPFLPYDPEMHVGDASRTHVYLLNKFNVMPHHLLVVTRAFEEQLAPLTGPDFDALCLAMAGTDGLAFYNGGPEGGASQRHKHLQVVPLPLDGAPDGVPIEAAFAKALQRWSPGQARRSDALPFEHAIARLEQGRAEPAAVQRAFEALCTALSLVPGRDADMPPYNLLMTHRWMMVVPRRAECFDGISVNALGFAGALLVRDDAALERVRSAGPMRVLRTLSGVERRSDG